MMNFRNIEKVEEILKFMKDAPLNNRGEIWQTLPEVRYHYKIANIKDDPFNKAIVIESKKRFEFSSKYPIYVRINYSDMIFKLNARSFIISNNKVACVYPTFAKAVEKRGTHRIPLPEGRETSLVLCPLGAGAAELGVRLLDISKKGLGISISDMNRDYLIRNKSFKITSINDIYLSGEHQVEIRYVERMGKGVLKSGFVLKHPFTDTAYEMICKIIFGDKSDKAMLGIKT